MVVGKRTPLQRIGHFAAHTMLMAGALIMVMPMIWMLVTSFKPPTEIALLPPVFWPRLPTTANFTGAFQAAPLVLSGLAPTQRTLQLTCARRAQHG
jgi:ABC-type glycerol-3-phosphate transport system permease component